MCNAQLFLIRPVYTTVQHVATEQTLLHRDVSETWPSTSSRNAGCSSDPVCLSCKGFLWPYIGCLRSGSVLRAHGKTKTMDEHGFVVESVNAPVSEV